MVGPCSISREKAVSSAFRGLHMQASETLFFNCPILSHKTPFLPLSANLDRHPRVTLDTRA